MDLGENATTRELRERLEAFMDEHIYPNEDRFFRESMELGPWAVWPVVEELKPIARAAGLWNLFLPDSELGSGLTNLEYAPLCEVMGRSHLAPEVFNCAAPDTGNMEILAEYGDEDQRRRWLDPALAGEIRTCFSMTEPETSGSDPTGLAASAELDGDEWVINGRKWYTTGANGAALAVAMVVTEPEAGPYQRASMILVPTDAPGFELVRPLSVMGHSAGPGHWEVAYEDCRVPAGNLLGTRGAGFLIAQDRLGPGRIHHCMRAIGSAERALEMMSLRAHDREAFGGPLADKQFVQDFIARSRMEIDQARLLTLYAAWKMDTEGKRAARQEISMIKVVAATVLMDVLDRAIQVHGGLGMTDDTPLASMWRFGRALRLADGADEVHKMVIARREVGRQVRKREESDGQPG